MSDDAEVRAIIHALFDAHADGIFRYARNSLPNDIDAEDVVQEVFLRAYQSWGSFQGRSSAKTWLYTIARNYACDLLRKRRTEGTHREYKLNEMSAVSVNDLSQLEIDDLFNKLSPNYRQVLTLRAMDGFSVQETALALGWSQSRVRITYFRAKRKLSQLLKEPDSVIDFNSREGFRS